MKELQRITSNFTGQVRQDTMAGRDYLVAPMVMIVEGVHDGSNGKLLYTAEALNQNVQVWNHKPIVVYHPASSSACDPSILSRRQIGVIMNTQFAETENGPGLKAEAWLDEGRMNTVDERIPAAIENNEVMELSTGLFSYNEKQSGEFKGKHYDAIVRNMMADHLALLPDLKGACSVEDGAGFLRLNAKAGKITMTNNEMSHSNVRSLLNSWLQETKGQGDDKPYPFVEDVFDNFFIYELEAKFYKLEYSIDENNAVIVKKDEPIEVIRKTEWVTESDGSFVGNFGSQSNVETPLGNPANAVWNQNQESESTGKETPLGSTPAMEDVKDNEGQVAICGEGVPEGSGTPETKPLGTPLLDFDKDD